MNLFGIKSSDYSWFLISGIKMNLLTYLNQFSQKRFSWWLLFGFIVFFNACAYVFQYVMMLNPCVMCVYERVAMVAIGLAALLGAINPKVGIIRWMGIAGWMAASYKGLILALEHVSYQNSLFASCGMLSFPSWAPLNKWLPTFFEPSGDCSEIVWQFATLSMPQWLVIIFGASLVCAVVIALSQFFKTNTTL